MIPLVTAILGVAGQSLGAWIEGRNRKIETKLEIEKIRVQGQLEHAKNLAQIEAEYDNYAQLAMRHSWKDEYLVIILSLPFLISFATPYIALWLGVDLTTQLAAAWAAVGTAPDWYQWSFMGIIAATFGLRWASRINGGKFFKGGNNGKD